MVEALCNWLNNEVKLSKQITDIPSDFSNGYLFGELLYKHQLITSLQQFKDSTVVKDIRNNYYLLEKGFEVLSIRCNDDIKRDLISQKKYKTEMFLYKIKQKIASKLINFDSIMAKGENKIHSVYNQMTIPALNSLGNKYTKSNGFGNDIGNDGMKKEKRIESARMPLVKYDKLSLNKKEKGIIKDIINEEKQIKDHHIQKKDDIHQREEIKHEQLLKNDEKNVTNWESAIEIKKTCEIKTKEIAEKKTRMLKSASVRKFNHSNKENQIEIKAFDDNLNKLGLNLKIVDNTFKPNLKMVPTEIFMGKIKEKIAINEQNKKAHDKLQRIMSAKSNKSVTTAVPTLRPQSSVLNLGYQSSRAISGIGSRSEMKRMNRTASAILPPVNHNKVKDTIPNPITEQINKQENEESKYIPLDVFNYDQFFIDLNKENLDYRYKNMERKQKKREKANKIVASLVPSILELVDECYDYQITNKQELINLDDWRRLIQLFIEGKPLNPEKLLLGCLTPEINDEEEEQEQPVNDGNNALFSLMNITEDKTRFTSYDHETYLNYLNLIGEFHNDNLHNEFASIKLDLFKVLGKEINILIEDKFDYVAPIPSKTNRQKEKQKPDVYEPRKEDIELLTIPSVKVADLFFGDLIREIIAEYNISRTMDIREELELNEAMTKEQPESQEVVVLKEDYTSLFNSIPLKMSFNGSIFSGKQTQAKLIEEKYPNIKVYNIDKIISSLKEQLETIEMSVEEHPKFRTMKKAQIDQYILQQQQTKESIKIYIPLIKQYISEGPSNELIMTILLEKIKGDFVVKDHDDMINQIKERNLRKTTLIEEYKKITEELQAKKQKMNPKEEQKYKTDIDQLTNESYYGFILINYPYNEEQARLFEYKVNQYIQPSKLGKSKKQLEEEEILLICQKTLLPKQTAKEHSIFNLFFTFTMAKDEIYVRADNRKSDPVTGITYHMTYTPPPENDKKIRDRLVPLLEPSADQALINYEDTIKATDGMMPFYLNLAFNRIEISTHESITESHDKILKGINESIKRYEDNLTGTDLNFTNQLENSILCTFANASKAKAKFFEFKNKIGINTFSHLYIKWKETTSGYLYHCKNTLNSINKCDDEIIKTFKLAEGRFMKFLFEKTAKKDMIKSYINQYQSFCEQYESLRLNEIVKKNFLKKLEDLTEQLWECITIKKHKAIKELTDFKATGFIEAQMNKLYEYIERLFIIETEKLFMALGILNACEGKDSFCFPFKISHEIIKNTLRYPLNNKGNMNNCPRLNVMYNNCIVLLFRYIVMISHQKDNNQTIKNLSESAVLTKRKKKGGLRDSKRLMNDNIISKEINEDEVRISIRNQLNMYKQRISALKLYAQKRLKAIDQAGIILFKSLDTWIITSIAKQNSIMNDTINQLKEMIDTSTIIEITTEMDVFNGLYDPIVYSLYEIRPELNEENSDNEIYSLNNFISMLDSIKQYELCHNIITRFNFEEVFIKGYLLNEKNTLDFSKKLHVMNYHHFFTFMKYFVFESEESSKTNDSIPEEMVNIDSIMTILLLIHCRKPRDDEISQILTENKEKIIRNSLMEKDDFLEVKLWFEEEDEVFMDNIIISSLTEETKVLSREEKALEIKKCLFEINKINSQEINFRHLLQLCQLKELGGKVRLDDSELYSIRKYHDLFFIKQS